jgi:hypothetical protein
MGLGLGKHREMKKKPSSLDFFSPFSAVPLPTQGWTHEVKQESGFAQLKEPPLGASREKSSTTLCDGSCPRAPDTFSLAHAQIVSNNNVIHSEGI